MSEPYWEPLAASAVPAYEGAMVLIGRGTIVTPASIDFQGIPQTYKHLRLIGRLRGGQAAAVSGLQVRLNGDGTAQYYFEQLAGNAAAASAAQYGPVGAFGSGAIPAAQAGANDTASMVVDFPYYAAADARKTMLSTVGFWTQIAQTSGLYTVNAAISRITLFDPSGTFTVPTILDLYGII